MCVFEVFKTSATVIMVKSIFVIALKNSLSKMALLIVRYYFLLSFLNPSLSVSLKTI